MDNSTSTSFGQGFPQFFNPRKYLQYNNHVFIKLDDFINAETIPTAGFTGIGTDMNTNTRLRWYLANYTAATLNPTKDATATAVGFDIMFYYSSMLKFTKEGDFIITVDMN